jgi:hypothetical protein
MYVWNGHHNPLFSKQTSVLNLNAQENGVNMKSEWFWLVGGILVAVGLLFMIGAFGDTGFGLVLDGAQQQASETYSKYGYDASLQVQLTSNGWISLMCIFLGAASLVGANATAWEDTEGY